MSRNDYYDQVEGIGAADLARLQAERLAQTVKTAAASPLYKEKFKQAGVDPDAISSLDDLRRLPLTTKDDLRANYPWGLLARPREDFVRLHVSSGTTGAPTAVFYTQSDLDTWAELCARSFHCAGVRKSDVLQNIAGYGLFTGGLGIHYGSERLGCLTIPAGAGNTARQLKLIKDFGVTVIHIIPSYALYLAAKIREMGVNPEDMPWRIALIGAEPHTEEARQRIQELLCLKAYNSYGLSEMNGPGVAFECLEQAGMHVWEDSYLVEILDPETMEPVAEGEVGEVVMTTLRRQGMPLVRYRTKDLTRFIPGQCACDRTHRRLDRIKGRTDDMFILKGVNIYPMQIEQILLSMPEVGQNYLIELFHENHMDQLKVKVEVKEEFFVEDMRALTGLQKRISAKLRDEILITPRVELVQHNSIPAGEGKAKRVVDTREA